MISTKSINLVTLNGFILINEHKHPNATGNLSGLLRSVGLAAKIVHREVNHAGLADILGDTGAENIQGETVKKLDEFANNHFIAAFQRGKRCCGIVSEENDIVNLLAKNAEKIKNYTERTKKQRGGERKNNKYYEDKYVNIKKLKENIEKLIKKIKETEGFDDNNDPFENKDNKNMILDPKSAIISIYKNIWNDYVKETKKNKAKGVNIENLKQDDRLYNRFIENNLDPTEV